MKYDFVKEGKQIVFEKLIKDINGKNHVIQSSGASSQAKKIALMQISSMAQDANEILRDLTGDRDEPDEPDVLF